VPIAVRIIGGFLHCASGDVRLSEILRDLKEVLGTLVARECECSGDGNESQDESQDEIHLKF
jgi:hypothetical protein